MYEPESTLISIEMIDGVKHIHYLGYGYYCGEPKSKPYRWVDYTYLVCSLTDAIRYGAANWESDNQEFVKQYIEDLSEEEFDEKIESENHPVITPVDITPNIPCGLYYLKAQTKGDTNG